MVTNAWSLKGPIAWDLLECPTPIHAPLRDEIDSAGSRFPRVRYAHRGYALKFSPFGERLNDKAAGIKQIPEGVVGRIVE
jgi:hypothetical protein